MSLLLIDIGNTRIKWARLEGRRLRPQQAAPYAGWKAADFERRVFTLGRDVERVIVVSVASAELNRLLTTAARHSCGLAPQFIKTQRRAAGLTTLYQEPWRLGVDRFVAAIGAHRLVANQAVCVADVGTAMTLDLIDADGVHLGGAIVPGPDLMIESLLKDTVGIQRRARGAPRGRGLFARNTRAAVEQGARYAVAAAIDRAMVEAKRSLKESPRLILTGGAAPSVSRLICAPLRVVPELVLRGLAALATES